MKSLPFTAAIWQAKLKVLQGPGEAQTRRLEAGLKEINKEPNRYTYLGLNTLGEYCFEFDLRDGTTTIKYIKPRHHEGEIAYVPEAWCAGSPITINGHELDGAIEPITAYPPVKGMKVVYKADWGESDQPPWRSPRFMPAWAARWFVQIVGPPVPQRVMEITEAEAMAEGAESISLGGYGFNLVSSYRQGFERMWDSVYPRHPFSSNPFVWVYTFQLVDKPVGTEGRRPCRGWRIGVEYDQRIL